MDRITLSGQLTPADSFGLAADLDRLTAVLRPSVIVDMADVEVMHPSIVSVLIRARRQAHRQGGDVLLIAPDASTAHHTLDHAGLGMVGLAGVSA